MAEISSHISAPANMRIKSLLFQLPKLVIWVLAANERRMVPIFNSGDHDLVPSGIPWIQAQRDVPAILHASFEARQEALQYYEHIEVKRLRREKFRPGFFSRGRKKMIYINFYIDPFVTLDAKTMELISLEEDADLSISWETMEKVKHLDMSLTVEYPASLNYAEFMDILYLLYKFGGGPDHKMTSLNKIDIRAHFVTLDQDKKGDLERDCHERSS